MTEIIEQKERYVLQFHDNLFVYFTELLTPMGCTIERALRFQTFESARTVQQDPQYKNFKFRILKVRFTYESIERQ